jgi:hypothetical protein
MRVNIFAYDRHATAFNARGGRALRDPLATTAEKYIFLCY